MCERISPVSGDRCHRSRHLRHRWLQPAGRRPRSLHQPDRLHLRGLPGGRGGGSAERCPAGLQPHRHEQTLRSAASCSDAPQCVIQEGIPDVCVLPVQVSILGPEPWTFVPSSPSRTSPWTTASTAPTCLERNSQKCCTSLVRRKYE